MAEKILADAKAEVALLSPKHCLAIVLVGENPGSVVYTRNKAEDCRKVGIESRTIKLPAGASEKEIIGQVRKLNSDSSVDAVLVQLPLPDSVDEESVLAEISPEKDVDGFHPQSMGRVALGLEGPAPCTPQGVIYMLKESGVELSGKHAVVIGRSRIVGKPLAMLLLNNDCTVTVCHSRTKNVAKLTKQADIICVAVGKPRVLTAGMVKKGAIVIDVGINREGEKLVGDVDFGPVSKKASFITPVPGGVGPMTRAMLARNTIYCYLKRHGK